MTKLLVQDIEVLVERKMIRNMRLGVYPPMGEVKMSVPLYVTDSIVRTFVDTKLEWIRRARKRVLSKPHRPILHYTNGEVHFLFGKPYTLRLIFVVSGKNRIEIQEDEVLMYCRETMSEKNRKALLYSWYREQLETMLSQLVEDWCSKLNEAPVTWHIRLMKTEWGSCMARRRKLMFNLDLARIAVPYLEYVVVHELSHLRVQNHGLEFQKLMTERLHNWRLLRKELNQLNY